MRRKRNRICIFCLVILIFSSSCSSLPVVNDVNPLEERDKLVVYTSHKEEVYGPIINEFEERTGLWVQVISGGTTELLYQIENESNNVIGDVMFGGGVDSLDSYSQYFAPYTYTHENELNKMYKSKDNKWTVFSRLPIVLIYNNKLVYEAVAPQSWNDLLQERWKGKIAYADPNNSGSSYTILNTIIQVMGKDNWNTINQFYSILDGKILEGSGDVLNEVDSGTKLVGITLEESAIKKIKAGADITIVYPLEGTSVVPDGTALILNAPHKENARLFMDFIIGKDVQKMIVEQNFRRSVRGDIAKPTTWKAEEVKLIDFDLIWAIENRNEILKRWNEMAQ